MSDFASRLIIWQKQHGRHGLPWQNTTNPYAIWVSEIMLQQTQVSAVVAYYSKFMARFPTIAVLANASQDEVLQHWSGLGYYSRARNLHKAAQTMMSEHGGHFPQDFNAIQSLAGIGRSTAAAIASFAFHQKQTILDGNVKRVLARHFAIAGWPGTPKIEKELWLLAEGLLPDADMVAYTQGLMDLGATLCTRSKPKCGSCPLNGSCEAYKQNRVHEFPTSKPRKTIPEKHITMLIFLQGNEVMLEKRPSTGIWGGLWSFPETQLTENFEAAVKDEYSFSVHKNHPLPQFSHTFTHFKLHITPQPLLVLKPANKLQNAKYAWFTIDHAMSAAIPTPVRVILQSLPKIMANYLAETGIEE